VKPLARWSLRQLGGTRLFQTKPLLAPLLRALWHYAWAPTPEAAEAAVRGLALAPRAAYPILFRDRHGLEYLLYPDENAEIYLAQDGNYEVGETAFCLGRLQPGMIAFDVGANIGLYTLLFAKCLGPAGQVHAFEPEPRNFRRLQVNLAINGHENVTANQVAVYSRSGPATLNVFPGSVHALHSLKRATAPDPARPQATLEPERQLTIAAVSLDDYCAEHDVEHIDYLKIDVEGAELEVLQGAGGLLSRRAIGLIQFEALPLTNGPADGASGSVFRLLRDCGFECHPIGANGELLPAVPAGVPAHTNYAAVRRT
jgi:FkbM family methyltransferase